MKNVSLTQLEVPDFDLGLRGKLLKSEKLPVGGRTAFCSIIYALNTMDAVTDIPISSALNGYPDGFAHPDENTRVELPWRTATEAVIADLCDEFGEPLAESPRSILSKLVLAYETRGLSPVLGFEYECHILHADDAALRSRDFANLRALGRADNAYSLSRHTENAALLGEFVDRMNAIGIGVDAVHSELGPGFFEYALSPMPALKAADSAARSRQYLRDLCAERGLLATFIAKLHLDTSGAGGHVHQSISRDGVNMFSDGTSGLSELGKAYLGGLVASMGDYVAVMNPFLNSYKRVSAGFFVAERATWGRDNRNAACRVITNSGPAAARIEHRRPGADANPYLVAAVLLAGGLEGIEDELDPGPMLEVGSDIKISGVPLPPTLAEATTAFRNSSRARKYLGDRFVDSYSTTRDAEVASLQQWWNSRITDFELERALDRI